MKPETIVINNFGNGLTRNNTGQLNSGFAKFNTSWGYNPFFKPGNLTWYKTPTDISSIINSGLALAAVSRLESGAVANYIITSTGHLFRVLGEGASGSDIHTLATGSPTFTYGASILFYGAPNTLFIGHDKGVTKIVIDASGNYVSESQVGTWDSTHFTAITTRRALIEFAGKLYVTNSDPSVTYANNIAEIDSTLTVTSYAKLSPSLPVGTYIRDMDVSKDYTYLLMSSSTVPSELIAPVNDTGNTASGESALYRWNGSDVGVTAGEALPNFGVTALESFSGNETMFMYDTFGVSLFNGGSKVISLRNQKSPMPGATATNGNFLTWTSPDVGWNLDTAAASIYGSLYYYGNLDGTQPTGLFRLLRQSSAIGGVIYQMPLNIFTTNRYISVNTSLVIQVDSNGAHLFSYSDYSGSGGSTVFKTFIFFAAPPDDSPVGWSGAVAGVYETQTQLFSKKKDIKQIRVYCEPTVANNGFTLDLIGSDGKKIANSAFSYTFVGGSEETKLQGALDRIDFNPSIASQYALGLRLTNTGSVPMTILKIEVDIADGGK